MDYFKGVQNDRQYSNSMHAGLVNVCVHECKRNSGVLMQAHVKVTYTGLRRGTVNNL